MNKKQTSMRRKHDRRLLARAVERGNGGYPIRPRKVIALHCPDESTAGLLRFLLPLKLAVRLTDHSTIAEALESPANLTLYAVPKGSAPRTSELAGADANLLIYDPHGHAVMSSIRPKRYLGKGTTTAMLIEALGYALVSRTGPKPKAA